MRSKAEWRAWAAEMAQHIDWWEAGEGIRVHVGQLLAATGPSCILTYLPMHHEIDLTPLVSSHPGHRFVLTRTPPAGPLTLHDFGSPRERHRFGFDQPTEQAPAVDVGEVDMALVPGMAFDRRGVRLGRGKGYFDVLLARLRDRVLVGVAPSDLVVEDIPEEPHDVRMTHLVTEAGLAPVQGAQS